MIEICFSALNSAIAEDFIDALNFELPGQEDHPEWIELVPAGPVKGRDGREWKNDAPEAIVTAFNSDGRDIVIDAEHATELAAPEGRPAPAYARIDKMEVRAGAVWGHVLWNPRGESALNNREYRYYSPVFIYRKSDLRIVQVASVGLTNRPNLRLKALNHTQHHQEEITMWKKLLEALGLADDAGEDAAVNAVKNLQGDLATANNRANTPDLEKFVPRGDYDKVLERATNAEKKIADQAAAALQADIDREIDTALKAGKITPATKDYYVDMCRQEGGLEKFKKFAAAAPVVGDPSGLEGREIPGSGAALNAEGQKIAEMFGNSAEDIAKYGK